MPRSRLDKAVRDPDRLAAVARTELLDAGPQPSFDRVGRLARRLLAAPVALVSLVDEDRQYFTCCLGLEGSPAGATRQTPLSHSICQLALVSDGPIVVEDVRADARLADNRAHELGAAAYLGIPLVDGAGHVLGSFCVIDDHTRVWSSDEIDVMADLAASIMSEIQLRESQRELARTAEREGAMRTRAEQLLRLARALTGAAHLDDIVQRTSALGRDLVGASFANVAILDPEAGDLELRHGNRLDLAVRERWPRAPLDHSTLLGRAVLTGEAEILSSPAELAAVNPATAADVAQAGIHAAAAFPIRRGRSAMGFAWDEPVEFTPTLRSTLTSVVALVGHGLERAAEHERDRRIADQLQRSLLPLRFPEVPGATAAARYEAGAAGLHVGGDWYEIVAVGHDRFVLALGDVVGHGLQAAATMGQLRNAFAALTPSVAGPAALLARLDEIADEIEGARLSTMLAASYAASSGELVVAAAGHLPPLVRRQDGTVEQLPDAGPPLGLVLGRPRRETALVLAPGDVLVACTDGLIERRGESIDVGLGRLRAALAVAPSGPAAAIVEHLYGALGEPRDDDVALVVLARDPIDGTATAGSDDA